jgi:hypothetical protein
MAADRSACDLREQALCPAHTRRAELVTARFLRVGTTRACVPRSEKTTSRVQPRRMKLARSISSFSHGTGRTRDDRHGGAVTRLGVRASIAVFRGHEPTARDEENGRADRPLAEETAAVIFP